MPGGKRYPLRALINSGSQASFITNESACRIMLHRCHSAVNISTFASNNLTQVLGQSKITIAPCGQKAPSLCVDTYFVPQITGPTPQTPIIHGEWAHIQHLQLADRLYYRPQAIDLLLGADVLPLIFLEGKATGRQGEPMAIETIFGWILMGPVRN